MSDRTPLSAERAALSAHIHACPPHQVRDVLRVMQQHDLDVECGDDTPVGEGCLRLQTLYLALETPCGTVDELAKTLMDSAPECTFTVWEDPKDEWLGVVHKYTPSLGHFTAECDSNGDAQLAASTYYASTEFSTAVIERALGIPWLDEVALLGQEPKIVAAPDAAATPAAPAMSVADAGAGSVSPADLDT